MLPPREPPPLLLTLPREPLPLLTLLLRVLPPKLLPALLLRPAPTLRVVLCIGAALWRVAPRELLPMLLPPTWRVLDGWLSMLGVVCEPALT